MNHLFNGVYLLFQSHRKQDKVCHGRFESAQPTREKCFDNVNLVDSVTKPININLKVKGDFQTVDIKIEHKSLQWVCKLMC